MSERKLREWAQMNADLIVNGYACTTDFPPFEGGKGDVHIHTMAGKHLNISTTKQLNTSTPEGGYKG
ncbi:hypothetical protein [Tannerella forsythia]|uniref:hypothetical protein n=1 Tax=Tannerella forsythia TaxID=28112 RepID=UPI001C896E97|nr:hypothetical protein [Tannerella forsythia]